MKIQSCIYGKDVLNLLKERERGRIHSVYNSSVNLSLGDRLINISNYKNGIGPFTIGVAQKDISNIVDKVKNGDKISFSQDTGKLNIHKNITISLDESETYSGVLSPKNYDYQGLKKNIENVYNIIKINPEWKLGIEDDDFNFEIKKLTRLLKKDPDLCMDDVMGYWIGRGKGLTPSGDDIIIGISSILTALNKRHVVSRSIDPYVLDKAINRTTKISYEYLWYSTQRKYSSKIIDICNSLLVGSKDQVLKNTINLCKVGHTSGFDSLCGILIGTKIALEE